MSTRDYPRLGIEAFGNHLLESLDLDPIYVALNKCRLEYQWSYRQLSQWLVAYWCFYDAGVACWMSEMEEHHLFWRSMGVAAANEDPSPINGRWKRGHERRHFRGAAAEKSIRLLADRYLGADQMVDGILAAGNDIHPIMIQVVSHFLFGKWIAFKVADMVDRCLGHHVMFRHGHVFMFKDPVEAALMLWRQHLRLDHTARPKNLEETLRGVVEHLEGIFRPHAAPPMGDRPVGLPEVETILCKWKSHMNGHYPLWNDTDEINSTLEEWLGVSEAAAAFHAAMPRRT